MLPFFREKRRKSWQKSRTFKNSRFSSKRKNNLVKILKILFIAGAVFSVVYFLFFSQFFLIKEIKINGNRSINSENIKNGVTTEMSNAIFGFIPGNNFLFNENEKIKTVLTEEFSEIESVEVKKVFPNILEIKITEKKPIIIWCRFDDCYCIDSNGTVFTRAADDLKIDANKRIIKIIEEEIIKEEELIEEELKEEELAEKELTGEGLEEELTKKELVEKEEEIKNPLSDKGEIERVILNPIEINDKVSDSDFISFALNIDREIKRNTQLKIKFYKTKGTNTRELIAYTDKNTRLYFNAMESANLQVKYLKDFLLKGVDENIINNLEYIYLESGNRVFYK